MQTQIVNFSTPKSLLASFDKQAKSEVKTRSEALREAMRLYVRQQQNLADILAYGRKQAKRLKIKPTETEKLIDEYRRGK